MFKIFKKTKNNNHSGRSVFSVAISEKIVQAALWEADQTVKVLQKSVAKPYFNDNDLLVKLDSCLQELGPQGESVHETLFHLDSSFTFNQEILAEKKDIFQNVTQSLQLESLGFVSNVEAVINAKLAQNPALSLQLMVEFVSSKVNFSLYQGKTLLETVVIENKNNFKEIFKAALIQLATHLKQDYTHYFQEINELEPAVAEAEPIVVNFISALITSAEIQEMLELLPTSLPIKPEVLGSDILLAYILLPSANIIAKSYGWLQEISEEKTEVQPASEPPSEPIITQEPPTTLSRQKNFTVPKVVESDFTSVTQPNQKKPANYKKIAIISSLLALIVLIILAFWYTLAQTTVTIALTPKVTMINKNLEVVIDPLATAADYESLILPGEIITKEIKHFVTLDTTGEKDAGEKAYGKVDIINKRTEEKKLSKGTIITANGLNFLLNDDVTIPAAEKTEVEGGEKITFTKKDANVTAQNPGEKGNLKNETNFKIDNYSTDDLEAKSVEDFKGGTDKTLKVFAAEDEKKALAIAQEELLEVAIKEIGEKQGDTYLVLQKDKLKITNKKFDAKIGDETEEVELEVLATIPVISYKLDELGPLSAATLEKELPESYGLIGDKPSYLSAINEEKTNNDPSKIYLDVDVSQEIQAIIDPEQIRSQLLGANTLKAENILKNLAEVKSYTISWSNSLKPKISGKIPKMSGKVLVEIKTN